MREKMTIFLASNWESLEKLGKRRLFWSGNGAEYLTLVIGTKALFSQNTTKVVFFQISKLAASKEDK